MATSLTEDHLVWKKSLAQFFRRELRNDAGDLESIVFSDECKFSLSGSVNKQNCRIWGSERPKEVYETIQNSPQVMVWSTLSKKGIVGPYFSEDGNVAWSRYKRTLRYFLLPKLRNYLETMIFQKDCATPDYADNLREHLDRKLPGWWMGRSGPISWPARSPDLTPCDYYLLGHIKDSYTEILHWTSMNWGQKSGKQSGP